MIRWRVCSQPGCPTISDQPTCEQHRAAREQRRGSSTTRGYGYTYRRALAALKATQPTHCATCGQPFTAANPLTGGHVTAIRDGGSTADGLKPECRRCNYGWRTTGS